VKQVALARQVAQAVLKYRSDGPQADCKKASYAVTQAVNDYRETRNVMTRDLWKDEQDDGFEDELLARVDQFALAVQRTASYTLCRPQ
jgi:predicted transcriptional regulator